MQELESGIYFEDGYSGVTLGALTLPRGTLLIDAPLRTEDGRSWRAALLNRGSGIDRLLINLDSHPDRTIGVRSLESPVVAHVECAKVFENRSPTFKGQLTEVGAEWEQCTDLGSSRWASPDITYTERLNFHWGDKDVFVEYHPGPAPGASWVVIPEARIAFVGDAVPIDQPPFLAEADLQAWLEVLNVLSSPRYRHYTLISGRGGVITSEDIRRLRKVLKKVQRKLATYFEANVSPEEVSSMTPDLLAEYEISANRKELYEQRLRFGLQRYYIRHLQPHEPEYEEEE